VEAVSAQGNPWQLPAKQEPAEAPHERRGRNPHHSRRRGGQQRQLRRRPATDSLGSTSPRCWPGSSRSWT